MLILSCRKVNVLNMQEKKVNLVEFKSHLRKLNHTCIIKITFTRLKITLVEIKSHFVELKSHLHESKTMLWSSVDLLQVQSNSYFITITCFLIQHQFNNINQKLLKRKAIGNRWNEVQLYTELQHKRNYNDMSCSNASCNNVNFNTTKFTTLWIEVS